MVPEWYAKEDIATDLADTNKRFGDRAREGIRKVVLLRHEVVDEIEFGGKALEEQVAICSVHICFNVNLG